MVSRDLIIPIKIAVGATPNKVASLTIPVAVLVCVLCAAALAAFVNSYAAVAAAIVAVVLATIGHRLRGVDHKVVDTQAIFLSYEDKLVLVLPGARLFEGRYVDQHYVMPRKAKPRIAVSGEGEVLLQSRKATSRVMDGEEELMTEEKTDFDITFIAENEAAGQLRAFVIQEGY